MEFTYQQFQDQYYAGCTAMDFSKWLLQQPRDSGYASDESDLFAQAFNAGPTTNVTTNQRPSYAAVPGPTISSSSSSSSSVVSVESPFQYADSLCVPSEQWQPYDSGANSTYVFEGGVDSISTFYVNPESHLSSCDQSIYTPRGFDKSQQQSFQSQAPSASTKSFHPQPVIPEEPESPRGRASSRLPHTAVEQRYRRNLNMQFSKLRETVPNIQTSQPQRGGNPAKPSKSEILTGAVDYIKQLEEENRRLKAAMESSHNASRKRVRVD
ncbi:hypothetical protein MBLNU459_g1975t1 [Dothideomycetes sp. NU459]